MIDTNKLIQIITTHELDMPEFLEGELHKFGYSPMSCNDYVYARGEIPVLLVAHMDTVWRLPPRNIYHDQKKGVLWSPDGLGADDRAGIYAILHILKEYNLRPSVLFTAEEEIGCVGARYFAKDYVNVDLGVNFAIELDRRGKNDAVFYECGNEDFKAMILSHGFVEDYGSYTDICELEPFGMASVNLSVGYYGEHTKSEHLHLRHLKQTLVKVRNILESKTVYTFYYEYQAVSKYSTKKAEDYGVPAMYVWLHDKLPRFYIAIGSANSVSTHTKIGGPYYDYDEVQDVIDEVTQTLGMEDYSVIW